MYAVTTTTTSISFWEVNPSTGSRTSPAACVINSPPGRPDVYASSSDTLYAYLDDNDKFYEIDIDACTMSELLTISDIDRDFNGAAFVGGALYATELSGSSTIPLYTINTTNGAGDISEERDGGNGEQHNVFHHGDLGSAGGVLYYWHGHCGRCFVSI